MVREPRVWFVTVDVLGSNFTSGGNNASTVAVGFQIMTSHSQILNLISSMLARSQKGRNKNSKLLNLLLIRPLRSREEESRFIFGYEEDYFKENDPLNRNFNSLSDKRRNIYHQFPLHDLDQIYCHTMTQEEINRYEGDFFTVVEIFLKFSLRMDIYVNNVKNNITGVGVITNFETEGETFEENQYIKAFQNLPSRPLSYSSTGTFILLSYWGK